MKWDRSIRAALAAACVALFGTAAQAGPTLDQVRARGTLVCGIHTGVAGFALPDSRGTWQGLDVDLCRGLAVAIFNDVSKVRFVPLSSSTRFTALGSGEIDVLFRTSTQTMLREPRSACATSPPISMTATASWSATASASARCAR